MEIIHGKRHEWLLELTVRKCDYLLATLKIDFLEPQRHYDHINALLEGNREKIDMMWYLVEDQAKSREMDKDEFLDDIHYGQAKDALIKELLFFTQENLPEFLPKLRKMMETALKISELQLQQITAIMDDDEMGRTMDDIVKSARQKIKKEMDKAFENTSFSSPEPSALTQGR